jgi:hypothetical protein
MASLTPAVISRTGTLQSLAAASAGGDNLATNTGKEFLLVANGGGAPITVTLAFAATTLVDGQAPANKTVVVTNGTTKLIGAFPPGLYNDTNGTVAITYSAVTSVTVGAFHMDAMG